MLLRSHQEELDVLGGASGPCSGKKWMTIQNLPGNIIKFKRTSSTGKCLELRLGSRFGGLHKHAQAIVEDEHLAFRKRRNERIGILGG